MGFAAPFRADFLCESMFRDGFARLFKPRAIRASGNASGASVAAATRFLAEFVFGIEDTGTDKDGTIHAFA